MRSLIVEDENFGREMIKHLMTEFTNDVDTATNGAEAVQMFTRALNDGRPYRLICLDIVMPVMDGQEALKRMRQYERESGTPDSQAAVIIMTTALDSLQEIKEAIWQGECNDYLVKPISQTDLLALMQKYELIDQAG